MNRFKGLDLVDRVPEELWVEVCDTVQEAVIKTIPKKKKCKKEKWLSEEALPIAVKEEKLKAKKKRKDISIWMQSFKEYLEKIISQKDTCTYSSTISNSQDMEAA